MKLKPGWRKFPIRTPEDAALTILTVLGVRATQKRCVEVAAVVRSLVEGRPVEEVCDGRRG